MRWWGCIWCLMGIILYNNLQAQPQYAFRISFSDKAGSLPISNPNAFLSQRAIDRRTKQGIAIDATDQPVSPIYLADVLSTTSGKLHLTSRWLNYCVILLNDSSKMLLLQGKSYITDTKYIGYYPTGLHNKPSGNGKFNNEQTSSFTPPAKTTGSQTYYGGSYTQTSVVNGDWLHDHGYTGKGKLIAVFDEGFRYVDNNPAFDSMRQSGRVVDIHNFVLANSDVYDFSTHGTSSLSTMAGYAPGSYVGAAPEAEYALYITEYIPQEQEVELDNMLAATERADSIGADIVSESLGYNLFTNPVYYQFLYSDIDGKSTIAAQAANIATTKGMIFVASAGNEGGGGWNYILTPGDADSAITVGSVDEYKTPANNSSFGPNASGRRKPDVCMVGNPAAILFTGVNASYVNGTSFATPQLAGWAACLWQSSPDNGAYLIKRAIIESAHVYTTPDNHLGYGVPDFKKAQELLGVKDIPGPGLSEDNWVAIWPNPFSSGINLKVYKDSGKLSMTLNGIDGRQVLADEGYTDKGVHLINYSTPGLPAGIYFLHVRSADKTAVLRVVKY